MNSTVRKYMRNGCAAVLRKSRLLTSAICVAIVTASPADDMVATWTGAESGDATTANNWKDVEGNPVVPTADYTVKVAGSNVKLQIPSGSAFSCKSFDIGDCTFTDDCDWTGLAVMPTLSGTANLDGHVLKLNNLSAAADSAFSGGEGSTVEFAPPSEGATYAKMGESAFIDNIANLTLSGDTKILLSKDGAGGTLTVTELDLGKMHYAEFVQTNGTVNLGSTWCAIGGKANAAGHGVYRMTGGTLTASTDFTVGSKGLGEFIQTGGNVTLNSWFNIGRNGGRGTYTITGGAMTNTYNNTVFVGAEGGTGTIDIGGDASVNLYGLTMGGFDTNGNKGYLNMSGGEFKARNIGVLGGRENGYGEVNQNGGKVAFGWGLTVGGDGTGVYNLQSGRLDVQNAKTLTVGGSAKTTSKGTFTQKGGYVYPGPLCVGEGAGSTGLYTQDSGEIAPWGSVYIGRNGTGTYVQNNGTNTVNNNGILSLGANATGSGQYSLNGGELKVNQIVGGSGKETLFLNGGTLIAKKTGMTLLSNIDNVVFGNGGKIDTAALNVSESGCGFASLSGSTFEKTGEGTLTLSAIPPADSVTVSQGTLALSADCVNSVALAHRWSFSGDTEADYLADSVGGANAVQVGDAVAFSDGKVVMSGDGHGKGRLRLGAQGAGVLGTGEGATVEIWAKRDAVSNWARIMEYGTAYNCSWRVTWCNGTDGTKFECKCSKNGAAYGNGDIATPYEDGQSLYIVLTFNNLSGGTGKPHLACIIYDADTKQQLSSTAMDIDGNDLKLSDLAGATFLLGASFNGGDADAKATYDEVRIWHHVLSEEAVAKSVSYGSDATPEQIAEIAAAAVPLKLTVSPEATLDLGGKTLTQPVLDVGGTIKNGSLVVTKGLVVMPGQTMAVADGATLDISAVTEVTLKDPTATIPAEGWMIATSPSGGITPAEPRALTGALKGYTLFVTGNRIRIGKRGLMIMFR